jgi:O-antigen ligase
MYFYLQEKLEKRRIIFLSSLLIIIVFIIIIRSATQKQHLQPMFSAIMRLNYWKDTLKIIWSVPLIGMGLGNFNLFYSRYAHNSYLQIWAEMGIFGIISFLWLIIRTIKLGLHNIKNAPNKNQIASLIGANAVFLVHNFLDFSFFLPEVAFLWWIILGLIISKEKK